LIKIIGEGYTLKHFKNIFCHHCFFDASSASMGLAPPGADELPAAGDSFGVVAVLSDFFLFSRLE
jgi:hypothetical protein